MKTNNSAKRTVAPFSRIEDRLNIPRPVVVLAADFADGHLIAPHCHRRAQLIYAVAGVMTVDTAVGSWVAPPQGAVWIPAMAEHAIHVSGRLAMRSVYVDPTAAKGLARECCAVTVPSLLKELILYAAELEAVYPYGGKQERVMSLILDFIQDLEEAPLHLPAPKDDRLKKVADRLMAQPGNSLTLAQWGARVGASSRSLARLFKAQTGLTFGQWRQRVRLLEALRRLALEHSVTEVALELGYESPSAFIAMFRKTLGVTPGRYFRA